VCNRRLRDGHLYAAGRISYKSANLIIDHVRGNGLHVDWLIETHAHADHLSAAPYIQQLGGKLGIGEHIVTVQETFGKIFNEGTEFRRDGSQFDRLFKDGDTYLIGKLNAFVMHTPGHTPACDIRAGWLPEPDESGKTFLPVNTL
jgi:glyoxylase-like metal-dependent hydrolase (beta-lactamase superfamily II)